MPILYIVLRQDVTRLLVIPFAYFLHFVLQLLDTVNLLPLAPAPITSVSVLDGLDFACLLIVLFLVITTVNVVVPAFFPLLVFLFSFVDFAFDMVLVASAIDGRIFVAHT